MNDALGIFLALGALVLWSLSPFFFTATGRRIGPFATNLLRLSLAMPVLVVFCLLQYAAQGAGQGAGTASGFPGARTALVLAASGWVGLGAGDLFLYRSFYHIGPERTSLLISLAPAITTAIAWLFLGELLSPAQLTGITLVLAGVTLAVWRRGVAAAASASAGASAGPPLWRGGWNGAVAALCLGASTVLAREAFLLEPGLSPLYATTLRVGAAAVLILLIAAARGVARRGYGTLRDPWIRKRMLLGTLVGPVGGMTLYVAAMKFQPAGVVATITFMTPLLVMPLGAWHYGTRLGLRTVLGALAALAGVVLLGWNPG